MRIISHYKFPLAFRLFEPADETCVAGYDGGLVAPRDAIEYLVAGVGKFKLEITDPTNQRILFPACTPGFVHDNRDVFEVETSGAVNVSSQ